MFVHVQVEIADHADDDKEQHNHRREDGKTDA